MADVPPYVTLPYSHPRTGGAATCEQVNRTWSLVMVPDAEQGYVTGPNLFCAFCLNALVAGDKRIGRPV